jgi:hypothetical protein
VLTSRFPVQARRQARAAEIRVLPQGAGGQNEPMRDKLRAMATETMAIIEAGGSRSPGGRDVHIAAEIRAAVAGTLPAER